VDQELLLPAENRILRGQLRGCLRLSGGEGATLGEIGRRLGRRALGEMALRAGRHLGVVPKACRSHDGLPARQGPSKRRRGPDRSYDQREPASGALANLDHEASGQTVGHVVHRRDMPPAPECRRMTTRAEFIRAHRAVK
jgi:putative transposase